MSHASLWAEAAESGAPVTLVLEDDAVPDPELFRPVLAALLDDLGPGSGGGAANEGAGGEDEANDGAGAAVETKHGGGAASAGGVASDEGTGGWDLCYLYVYPDHWPRPPVGARVHPALLGRLAPRAQGDGAPGGWPRSEARAQAKAGGVPLVQEGFHTYCLVGYLVSRAGARRLAGLVASEEVYAPVDNMVSDWRERGLLRVRAPTAAGFVGNGGQLDLRGPGRGAMHSNIWAAPSWASVLEQARGPALGEVAGKGT